MAINLNPGADATLVGVAYRAAMANAPGDYSDTLERAADSYTKTMEAQSETWGNVAKLGANIGKEMVGNAKKLAQYAATGAGLNPDDKNMFMDRIYANKDAQKELGFMPGVFGDRQTKKDLASLKIEQQEIFAEIDGLAASLEAGTKHVEAGLYDATINKEEAEKVNAIIKSNLKDKNTENGNFAKLTRDKETDELIYTLYDSDTGNPTMSNGQPQTMTVKEFNESIANNTKDTKNVFGGGLSALENDIVTLAQKSKSGVIDDQSRQLALNKLDGMLQTDTDTRRAMVAKYGISGTSFIDDLTNKGAISASLYGGMLQQLGLAEGGQIPAEGAFGGIEDTDGIKGLNLNEINAAYGTYVQNIANMKDPEASKAAFKAVFSDRLNEAHKYGYGKRTIERGTDTDGSDKIDFYTNKVQKLNGANWNSGNATSVYNDIKAGVGFSAKDPATKEINDYSYHVVNEKGGWYQNYMVGDNETTTESYIGPNGGDVGKIFTNDPRFKNIETSVTVEEDAEGNVTNSREINIKTKTKKKYGSFKKGTQSIGLESILSSLQSFDKDKTLIQRQALIKFQEEVKNDTYDNRYKLVQHINSENNTSIGMDQLDTMINDLVADTDPLNNN